MKVINYITKECFKDEKEYKEFLKIRNELIQEKKNKNIKVRLNNPIDRI